MESPTQQEDLRLPLLWGARASLDDMSRKTALAVRPSLTGDTRLVRGPIAAAVAIPWPSRLSADEERAPTRAWVEALIVAAQGSDGKIFAPDPEVLASHDGTRPSRIFNRVLATECFNRGYPVQLSHRPGEAFDIGGGLDDATPFDPERERMPSDARNWPLWVRLERPNSSWRSEREFLENLLAIGQIDLWTAQEDVTFLEGRLLDGHARGSTPSLLRDRRSELSLLEWDLEGIERDLAELERDAPASSQLGQGADRTADWQADDRPTRRADVSVPKSLDRLAFIRGERQVRLAKRVEDLAESLRDKPDWWLEARHNELGRAENALGNRRAAYLTGRAEGEMDVVAQQRDDALTTAADFARQGLHDAAQRHRDVAKNDEQRLDRLKGKLDGIRGDTLHLDEGHLVRAAAYEDEVTRRGISVTQEIEPSTVDVTAPVERAEEPLKPTIGEPGLGP